MVVFFVEKECSIKLWVNLLTGFYLNYSFSRYVSFFPALTAQSGLIGMGVKPM